MIEEREASLIATTIFAATKLSPSSSNLSLATTERKSDKESLKEREEIVGLVVERNKERERKERK